jgi:hypothetical protein
MRRVYETIVAVEKQYVLHIFLCMCACMVACVHGCVCVPGARACVGVALLIQHATRMCLVVVCSLSGSTVFFDIFS